MLNFQAAAAFSSPLPIEQTEAHWFALYTRSRHEKRIAEQLERKQIEHFLPLYESVHRWRDRSAKVRLPLFPGYIFVRLCLTDRLQVLQLPGVVRFVSFSGQPHPLPESQLETLRNGLANQLRMEPHPFLRVGRRVRIRRGALQGAEGILLRRRDYMRFIISLELLMRSVAVEVDAADVEPI